MTGGTSRGAGWGPTVPTRLAWVLMELPAVLTIAFFILTGPNRAAPVTLIFLGVWQAHYLHRTFIFPLRMRETGKRTPVLIVVLGIAFNVFNGYLNGRYLGVFADAPEMSWLADPRFVVGLFLFVAGMAINLHADEVLFRLRKPGETGYRIPQGGLYRYVSCPNYFGECIEWIGWAVLTWSLPGLCFATWTAANLLPRALTNHQWYHDRFPEYPPERKAVIPFLF